MYRAGRFPSTFSVPHQLPTLPSGSTSHGSSSSRGANLVTSAIGPAPLREPTVYAAVVSCVDRRRRAVHVRSVQAAIQRSIASNARGCGIC